MIKAIQQHACKKDIGTSHDTSNMPLQFKIQWLILKGLSWLPKVMSVAAETVLDLLGLATW